MAVILPVVSKFDDSGLKRAKSAFSGLSKNLKGTLGAIGLATSFVGVVNALKNATKAAAEDVKSQQLLANQLRNTVGASDSAIAASEKFISSLQMQTSIADDSLRPALATLVRSTGDVGKAQELLALSTNIAAGTGKDLSSVSMAVAKAAAGQTTALFRLVPSLKGSSDWAKSAAHQFDGMAASAANTDPFQRLTVIFGEIQEQIGMYLLPVMQDLANYLASDAFASVMDSVFAGFDKIGSAIDVLIEKVPSLGGVLDELGKSLDNGNWVKAIPIVGAYIDMLARQATPTYNGANFGRRIGAGKIASSYLNPGLDKGAVKSFDSAAKAAKAKADAAAKKLADAAKKAIAEQAKLVADFTSNIGELAKAFAPLGQASQQLGDFEQQAVDSFTAINEAVAKGLKDKAISQAAADYIYNYIKVEKVALTALARQRDVLLKKIQIAQDISRGVVDAVNITGLLQQETKSVTKSVTTLVDGIATTVSQTFDEVVTGNLTDSFKKLVEKTKTFAKNLASLKKLGLNGTLFKQIVDAGQEAGGATAEAIIAGGADTVNELNNLFDELNTAGSDIAATSTDTFYSLGEGISNSFIDGLKSQEQTLADEIAKMVASIEEAFTTMMANLDKLKAGQMTVNASSLDTFQYARILAGAGNPLTAEDVRFANIGQRVGATVNVTVNAGLGTNGKAVGQQITSLLNQYTKANA